MVQSSADGVRVASHARTVRDLIDARVAAQPQAVYAQAVAARPEEGTDEGAPPASAPERITYGSLAADCRRVAAWLRELGSAPGDTIALVMPNGLQTLRLLLGAMHGGWCVNPVNLLAQPQQMRHVLEHSDCRIVFTNAEREAAVRALVEQIERPLRVVVTEADGSLPTAEWEVPAPPPSPDDVALLMYTSGTTGLPKGVMLTHSNLCANAHAIVAEHGLSQQDRVLAVLPLYHINAFTVTMLAPLASGGSLAMVPRFSAGRFWQQALESQCTWLNVVPTIVSFLLEGDDAPAGAASRLRFCRSASAALPPEHLTAFEKRFAIGIVETMGLTETAAPAFSNPMDPALRKTGSVGRASGCEACVVDADLSRLPDGAIGEILIRGPNVMRGYYKNPEATAQSFAPDGWLRTGDLGRRDADGFFFVTGRIKELIIKGGENIAPREIDEALLRHPAVLDAAAVGMPDRHYGQEILACVVLRPGQAADEADLRAFCETHLGRFKTPKVFRFVDGLPRGPSGKVQRLKLIES